MFVTAGCTCVLFLSYSLAMLNKILKLWMQLTKLTKSVCVQLRVCGTALSTRQCIHPCQRSFAIVPSSVLWGTQAARMLVHRAGVCAPFLFTVFVWLITTLAGFLIYNCCFYYSHRNLFRSIWNYVRNVPQIMFNKLEPDWSLARRNLQAVR